MQWSDIKKAPSARTLRQFGLLCLVIFGGLALWNAIVLDNLPAGAVLGALALTLGPLGLIRPQALKWVYVGWMIVAFPIGWTVSKFVLGILFYGLFTPIALVFRLVGRDALRRRPKRELSSYWMRKAMPADVTSYFRQS